MMFLLMVSTLLSVETQTRSIDSLSEVKQNHNPKLTSLIAPTILIGTGIVGLHSHWLQTLDSDLRKEILKNSRIGTIYDDVSQYVPMTSVYGLNALVLSLSPCLSLSLEASVEHRERVCSLRTLTI